MNNDRRRRITEALNLLQQAQGVIEEVRDEEQESYDNMPEGFQNGERGERAMMAIDALETAFSDLEGVMGSLEEAAA